MLLAYLLLFILIVPRPIYADYLSTPSVLPKIPPTIEGPGLILPDSPLFFLDELKQSIRLVLAFAPLEKTRVYANIAGERFAELRFMLEKGDKKAVMVALNGVSDNFAGALDALSQASFQGADVASLALSLNDGIRDKQRVFDRLEIESSGDLKIEVKRVEESLFASKAGIGNYLRADLSQNEARYDLEKKIARDVRNASEGAAILAMDIEESIKESTVSAKVLLSTETKAAIDAMEALNSAILAVANYRDVHKAVMDLGLK